MGIKSGSVNINNLAATIKKLSLCSSRKKFVQLCPIEPISSLNQIIFAAEQAIDSFNKGTNFSKKIELEFLLRLSGTRQINKAIGKMLLKEGRNRVVLVAAAKKREKVKELLKEIEKQVGFREDGNLMKGVGKNKKYLMEIYSLGEEELESLMDKENALEEAVLEKIALVALEG